MNEEQQGDFAEFKRPEPKVPASTRKLIKNKKSSKLNRRRGKTQLQEFLDRTSDRNAYQQSIQLTIETSAIEAHFFTEFRDKELAFLRDWFQEDRKTKNLQGENSALGRYYKVLDDHKIRTLSDLSEFYNKRDFSILERNLARTLSNSLRQTTLDSYLASIKRFNRFLEAKLPNHFNGLGLLDFGRPKSCLSDRRAGLGSEDFEKVKNYLNDNQQLTLDHRLYTDDARLLAKVYLYAAFYLGGRTKKELLSIRIETVKLGGEGVGTLIYTNQAKKKDFQIPVSWKLRGALFDYIQRKNKPSGQLFEMKEVKKALKKLTDKLATTVPVTAERLRPLVFEAVCKRFENDYWRIEASMMCSAQTMQSFLKRRKTEGKTHEIEWGKPLTELEGHEF